MFKFAFRMCLQVFVFMDGLYIPQDKETALHSASQGGHHDIMRLLLGRADLNIWVINIA